LSLLRGDLGHVFVVRDGELGPVVEDSSGLECVLLECARQGGVLCCQSIEVGAG
jgi:hypothetical protein